MMKALVLRALVVGAVASSAWAQGTGNLRQYYSGKFGYYQPDPALNDGLLFGMDGVTEFIHYNITLTGAIDFYQKRSISVFKHASADIHDQAVALIPLHANVGYKLLEIDDADTRVYAGAGGGYSLFFYSVRFTAQESDGFLGGTIPKSYDESKNGGMTFGTAFLRLLIGRMFIEPRWYFASRKDEPIGEGVASFDPSGFALTLGFQYRQ